MKIQKIDHIGIIVNDLPAAQAFFLDLGLEMVGEGTVEGEWAERIRGWRRRQTIYAYFNNDWNGFAPANARLLLRRLDSG